MRLMRKREVRSAILDVAIARGPEAAEASPGFSDTPPANRLQPTLSPIFSRPALLIPNRMP